MQKIKSAFLLFSILFSIVLSLEGQALSQGLKLLPIQEAGRVKPFETFAREALQMVHGKEHFEGKPAEEIVLTWLIQPEIWENQQLIEVKHNLVKKGLKLDNGKKYFTLKEIWANDRLPLLMQELESKRETKEKLDPYFQALQRLEGQLYTFRMVASGQLLRFVPPQQGDAWKGLSEFSPEEQQSFAAVSKAFVEYIGVKTQGGDTQVTEKALDEASERFSALARNANPGLYPSASDIRLEVFYNGFHPYRWAWIVYVLAAVLLGLQWILNRAILYKMAWALVLTGFVLQIFAMAIRMQLMGRPPVTNMYETVVWVAFGTVLFAMILEYFYRWRFMLLAGSLVSAFCLVLANMAPAVLDASLQPLEPVLRSNYWLTIHVMTITISYAAFFLAFALGDVGLIYFIRGEQKYQAEIKAIVLGIYRSLQIGVAFLAPGIILGGIWADYSWGRFWGWDPKETWALIALLGYIAVLHGRLAGLLKDFGMIASGILTFSLVIMAWYGVNFVLGAGLHSYGFGAGGVEYVSTFVAVHILAVVFVAVLRQGKLKAN
jgi:ABC-type transport system involved in cytochrome c biogenesis permease subunit